MRPIGHGIDLVDLERFERALQKGQTSFLNRIFTKQEQSYCQAQAKSTASFAARFAAKEAVVKALGTGFGSSASPIEIEVISHPITHAPSLILSGKAADTAQSLHITHWFLSLSHTNTQAMASVMAYSHTLS